jgi:glyoxylase-like metal-dependent hydrolase (beta-lactamase superfamily II)
MFETNTYVAVFGDKAVVIDPVGDTEQICSVLGGAELSAILLTHGHFDHTSSAAELKSRTGAKIHIHESDSEMLGDLEKSFGVMFPQLFKACEADVLLKDDDVIEIDGKAVQARVVASPGHSEGSVLYLIGDVMFSGDTLFAGSVGRIDGHGGSRDRQMSSLALIAQMQGEYRILPGHGEETTLTREKRGNPYLC